MIYDLKNANDQARISVKLVSEGGVGTIACGVAKAGANVILISGYDGGTGAAPISSIHHAGLPWELGLVQTHQALVEQGLRDRVAIETDGKLMSGRDVAIACLLGAEEFGFATAPLVTMGCRMMRVCNLDTCPFGVATQNSELRKRFKGKPEFVMHFMEFIAQELREIMAQLGFHSVDEMVGHSECLKVRTSSNARQNMLDYAAILRKPQPVHFEKKVDPQLNRTVDAKVLIPAFQETLKSGEPKTVSIEISSTNRTLGTLLGSTITQQHRPYKDNTFKIVARGGAGQSCGAFLPKGETLSVHGDANDYFGKGLSGGILAIRPQSASPLVAQDNVIIGNVALYGATSGKAFIRGIAGERFCVRNSGAIAVCEGCGDHGLEYMTGGTAVILGKTGKNFAAGMSGGIAYVWDKDHELYQQLNPTLVSMEPISMKNDIETLEAILKEHVEMTQSEIAQEILAHFDASLAQFKKIVPKDFAKISKMIKTLEDKGYNHEEAQIKAFEQLYD